MKRDMVYPTSYIIMIYNYLKWRKDRYGNRSVCLTYEGIFNWASRSEHYKTIARTTIERVMRRLAEDGFLKRVRERPRALFCITRKFVDALRQFIPIDPEFEVME